LNLHQRALRVGMASLLCAISVRFLSSPLPGKIWQGLLRSEAAAFLLYTETGQDVRFSSSSSNFFPDFVETPPPLAPEPEILPLSAFSDPEIVHLTYSARVQPDIESLLSQPLNWDLYGEEPTVLILHTHGTESYTKKEETYRETSRWRTLDENYNMLSIGDRVVQLLKERGIAAIQDRALHDYPSYNGSYTHARSAIREYLEAYPSISLILDLHRDATEGISGQLRPLTKIDGISTAQLMIVLGTSHEHYAENLSLALKLHAQLETQAPGITRSLQLRAQRFNQDLLPGALLVEVGAAGNTHPEALAAAEQLAEAVAALAKGTL